MTGVNKTLDLPSTYERDLLEPKMYPDPWEVRASLEDVRRDENALRRKISSNKASIKVIAPYLKIEQKDQQKIGLSSIKEEQDNLFAAFKLKDTERLKDRLANIFPDVTENYELVSSIKETADILKLLLRANTAVSYLVNPTNTREIFQVPQNVNSFSKITWKITPGSTMAAHAAFMKVHVVSDDVIADDRFVEGLGFTGITAKFGLCVPILTPDRKVIGVYEFSKDAYQEPFVKTDIKIALAVTGWMGVAILQNSLYSSMARQKELTDHLVRLTNFNFSDKANKDHVISNLVISAKDNIRADRCKLYMIDKKTKDKLIIDEYDQGFDSNDLSLYKRRSKKVVELDSSPLARVFFKSEIVNENNFESDEGKKSILCVPIICNDTVVGAIELLADNSSIFDIGDEEALREIALICSINIHHSDIHKKLKTNEVKNNMFVELLFHHMKPCTHYVEKYCKKTPTKIVKLPEDFFTFAWYPVPDDVPRLVELTISMFQEVLGESFMARNNIPKFVLTVQNCYRPNPYHNFLHAFVVTHTMANIIRQHHTIFTRLEQKGLMVAALCHDLDHRGYTNNFIQLTKHYLSTLYESSPLENHHFAVTKMITEQCGMFKDMKESIYNQLMSEIYELIIATDLSLYFQCRMELMRIADEKSFTFKDYNHRRLVKSLVMTECDLCGQTKPLPICQRITEDVYEEFFQEGDAEKAMGLVPLPAMDRDMKHMIADNQVQFLSTVVIPCVEIVSRFFSCLNPVLLDTKSLLKQWEELAQGRNCDYWRPEDSLSSF